MSGQPAETRTGTAGSWNTANGGTTVPAWASDSLGAYLNCDDASATGTAGAFEELHYAFLGNPNSTAGTAAFFAYFTLSSNYYTGNWRSLGASATNQESGLVIGGTTAPFLAWMSRPARIAVRLE